MFCVQDIALGCTEPLKQGDSPITANQSDAITHKEANRTIASFIHIEHFQNLRHQGRKPLSISKGHLCTIFPKITQKPSIMFRAQNLKI